MGPRLFSPYDQPFWDSVSDDAMRLQRCTACGTVRYPPGPACPDCLSADAAWVPASGAATVLSWMVFHRQYLPAYSAPHTVVAVQLEEGPIMVATVTPDTPEGLRVGAAVRLDYATHADGYRLPTFQLKGAR